MRGYTRRTGFTFRVWDARRMWYCSDDPSKMFFDYIILPNGSLARLSWEKTGEKNRTLEGMDRWSGDTTIVPPRTDDHDIMLRSPYRGICKNGDRTADYLYAGDIVTRRDAKDKTYLIVFKNEGWYLIGPDEIPKRLSVNSSLTCIGNIHEHSGKLSRPLRDYADNR